MKERIQYFLALCLIKFAKFAPKSFIFAFFDKLALFASWKLSRRVKVAQDNLRAAYPQKSESELHALAIENFRSIARTLTDTLLFYNGRLKFDDLISNGEQALERVRKLKGDNPHGILFFTAHFGNWEILANFFGANGFPVSVVGRRSDNELIEERLVAPFRERYGNDLIYKDDAMRRLVQALKQGRNVGILPDQKPGPKNSLITTFFGRQCYTTKTIASLYLKFRPVLIPIFARRGADNRYEIVIKDFPPPPEGLDKDEAELFITQKCNDIFEEVVRTAPQQWFWIHKRWKMD